jgi:hypothetical protein
MKKIITISILGLMLFVLASCNASTTKTSVRVVGLSFEGEIQPQNTNQRKSLQKLLNNNTLTNVSKEYIFHGDILIFTIEIEDPNFEFISLLSVEFNNKIIRANVNDSIVKTSDCGLNICVNFPFQIDEKVSEYTVQSVKFAKLNNDSGVDAIIDNQSVTTKVLDIYNQEIYPYVLESVKTLNDAIQNMTFYKDGDSFSVDEFNLLYGRDTSRRVFYVSGFNNNIREFDKVIIKSGVYDNQDFNESVTTDDWNLNIGKESTRVRQAIYVYQNTNYFEEDIFAYTITFFYYEEQYKQIFFYNLGNSIYVNILGSEHFVLEISKGMKINLYEAN